MCIVIEGDVTDVELLHAALVIASVACVFTAIAHMSQVAWTLGELEEAPSLTRCSTRLTGMASLHWAGGSCCQNPLIWCSRGSQ